MVIICWINRNLSYLQGTPGYHIKTLFETRTWVVTVRQSQMSYVLCLVVLESYTVTVLLVMCLRERVWDVTYLYDSTTVTTWKCDQAVYSMDKRHNGKKWFYSENVFSTRSHAPEETHRQASQIVRREIKICNRLCNSKHKWLRAIHVPVGWVGPRAWYSQARPSGLKTVVLCIRHRQ